MNIYETLRSDHDRQRKMLKELEKTEGDSKNRQDRFSDLKKELEDHAEAEEKFFYSELMKNDMSIEKARHSVAEHHELDELIEKLEKTEYSSPGWLKILSQLREKLIHHLEEEEHEVFQLSGKVLTESQKTTLGQNFRKKRDDVNYL